MQGDTLLTLSFSLAQRKELKETSTPSKPPPIWGGLTREIAVPADFPPFWYRGTRDDLSTSPLSPPLGKGLILRRKLSRKGLICAVADRKSWRTPQGRKLESHTKKLMKGGLPRNQLHPSHIGEGLVRVDVSLLLSLRQRK